MIPTTPFLMYQLHYVKLRILREYRYEIERQLGAITQRYRADVQQMSAETREAEHPNTILQELHVIESTYPQHFRRSFIALLLAISEEGLCDFCQKLEPEASPPADLYAIGRVLSRHHVLTLLALYGATSLTSPLSGTFSFMAAAISLK